jgi:cytidylate kinase
LSNIAEAFKTVLMTQHITIAVDGPAASGKGTLARRLADQFHLFYLDSGSVYRAVAKHILDLGKNPDSPEDAVSAAIFVRDNLTFEMIEDPALRNDIVADATSRSCRFPPVRQIITETLRLYATHPPVHQHHKAYQGSIVDGRDIGTVVCPDAEIKFFVTANAEIRAERRFKELSAKGIETSYETVLQDMQDRDARDSGRETAPLKAAADAIHFDTSTMDADTAFEKAVDLIRQKLA